MPELSFSTAFQSLRSSSSGFIISSSPIQSTSHLPAMQTDTISPSKQKKIRHASLLSAVPSTVLEEELQNALREVLAKNAAQKTRLIAMQSSLVLNGAYCDVVRGQLEAQEEKGCRAQNEKGYSTEHSTALAEWKSLEDARKARNKEIRARHREAVAAWEAERDERKRENKRPRWTKPLLKGQLFSPVPKPQFIAQSATPANGCVTPAGDSIPGPVNVESDNSSDSDSDSDSGGEGEEDGDGDGSDSEED
ncbi:hypothetical protein B0H13DRAFT_1852458 [Mycena leptocephala]|nr:hypothetical protein B0H13DRAFT_1852458 [Mycena leptocephala]